MKKERIEKNLKRSLSVAMAAALMVNSVIPGIGGVAFAAEFSGGEESEIELFGDSKEEFDDIPAVDEKEENVVVDKANKPTEAIYDIKMTDFTLYSDESLEGFTLSWKKNNDYGNGTCKIGIQKKSFEDNDFTDLGNYYKKYKDTEWPTKPDYDFVTWQNGEFSMGDDNNKVDYSCTIGFDEGTVTFDPNSTYYIYIWTKVKVALGIGLAPEIRVYPDAYICTLKTENGQIKDENGNLLAKVRNWTYEASGNTITAKCEEEGNEETRTLKIQADSKAYDGTQYTSAKIILSDGKKFPYTINDIEYYKRNEDGSYQKIDAPINAGTYYAGITVNNVTAYAEFEITKLPNAWITEPAISGWTYGESAENKISSGEVQFGTVAVTYSRKDGTELTDPTAIPTEAGDYVAHFKAITDNYEEISKNVDFTIAPRQVELAWSADDLLYNGQEQKITASVANKANESDVINFVYTGNAGTEPGDYTASIISLDNSNYTLAGAENINHNWSIKRAIDAIISGTKNSDSDDWYKSKVKIAAPDGYLISTDGNEWVTEIEYSETQTVNYFLKRISDSSVTEKKTESFKIDITAPTGTIMAGADNIESSDTGTYWAKDSLRISITGEDKDSGVDKIEYKIQKPVAQLSSDQDDWITGSELTLDQAGEYRISARITDKVGNEKVIESQYILIYKDSKTVDSVTYTKGSSADVKAAVSLNGNVVALIDYNDPENKRLDEGTDYEVDNENIIFKNSWLSKLRTGTYTLYVAYDYDCGYGSQTKYWDPDRGDRGTEPSDSVIKLTVKQNSPSYNPIYVTGISVTPENVILTKKDETTQLTATVTPSYADNKNVIWKSSDEKVATVDKNGKVTAIGNGTAIITATSVSGNYTAKSEITVKIPVEVEKITLTTDKEVLTAVGDLAQITAVIEPADADNKNIIWKSGDEKIATVDENGKVTAVADGTVTITAATEDGKVSAEITLVVKSEKPKPQRAATSGFRWLRLRSTRQTTRTITLNWKNLNDVDGYIIYGNCCGAQNKYRKIVEIKDNTVTGWTHTGLKKGTFYKYIIKAYKTIDGKKVITDTSASIHAVTQGGKKGVAKSVSVTVAGKNSSISQITLEKGQTVQIEAVEIRKDKPISRHRAIKYESSNKKVATVSSTGVITAKEKGTCKIWVYTQNGVYKVITVTVK